MRKSRLRFAGFKVDRIAVPASFFGMIFGFSGIGELLAGGE